MKKIVVLAIILGCCFVIGCVVAPGPPPPHRPAVVRPCPAPAVVRPGPGPAVVRPAPGPAVVAPGPGPVIVVP